MSTRCFSFQKENVMSVVFDLPVDSIDNKSSQDSIKSWDSLKHMNLVIALEEEFGMIFEDEGIIEMINYSMIVKVISKKYRG